MAAVSEANLSCSVDGDAINGTKIAVPDADLATHAIVLAKASSGIELRLVDLNAEGVSTSLQKNLDKSRSFYKVEFNNSKSSLLGESGAGWDSHVHIMDQAAVFLLLSRWADLSKHWIWPNNMLWNDMHLEDKLVHTKQLSINLRTCMLL